VIYSGSARPEVNESHPDGLDLSLFKDQAQLKKKRDKVKKKSTSPKRKPKTSASSSSGSSSSEEESDSSEESSSDEEEEAKPAKQTTKAVSCTVFCSSRSIVNFEFIFTGCQKGVSC